MLLLWVFCPSITARSTAGVSAGGVSGPVLRLNSLLKRERLGSATLPEFD
jgi:hypothetical protein